MRSVVSGFLLVSIIIHLSACSKSDQRNVSSNSGDSTDSARIIDRTLSMLDPGVNVTLTDIAYGSDEKQKMDLSLVAGRNPATPLVILLHGGGWSEGDKKDLAFLASNLYSQQVNIANINYRLTNSSSTSVRWTGILSDVNAAVTFLTLHADSLGIRKTDYVSFGFSAGAQLALLHSYSYDSSGLIAAVIGFGSPTKLNDVAWKANPFFAVAKEAIPPLTGQSLPTDTNNVTLKKLSPYYSPHFKPTLLIHGDQDNVVPYSQSLLMNKELLATGISTAFISLPHSGHSGEGASQADLNNAWLSAADWIKTYSH